MEPRRLTTARRTDAGFGELLRFELRFLKITGRQTSFGEKALRSCSRLNIFILVRGVSPVMIATVQALHRSISIP